MPSLYGNNDALLFRESANGAVLVWVPVGLVPAMRAQGFTLILDSRDVKWADVSEVRELDIRRFEDWRRSWESE